MGQDGWYCRSSPLPRSSRRPSRRASVAKAGDEGRRVSGLEKRCGVEFLDRGDLADQSASSSSSRRVDQPRSLSGHGEDRALRLLPRPGDCGSAPPEHRGDGGRRSPRAFAVDPAGSRRSRGIYDRGHVPMFQPLPACLRRGGPWPPWRRRRGGAEPCAGGQTAEVMADPDPRRLRPHGKIHIYLDEPLRPAAGQRGGKNSATASGRPAAALGPSTHVFCPIAAARVQGAWSEQKCSPEIMSLARRLGSWPSGPLT